MALIALFIAALFAASSLSASESQLDSRFTDADGDLIADPPSDSSQWVNPRVLVFSYTPVEDPAVYRDVWKEFIEHMEKVTGKRVQFFPVQSNAAQYEAMRAGRLHVMACNAGGVPVAVNLAGFRPFAIMADPETGHYGYEMEIIVPADSPITEGKQLKGQRLAFTSPTSNSGSKAPQVLLEAEFGLKPETDYTPVYSGGHDNSILGVVNGDYPAAAIANSVLKRMIARNVVDPAKIRTIYKSQSFPTSAYGYVYNLHPDVAAKVREAFFTFNWEGTNLYKEFSPQRQTSFIPITYKEHWAVIRQIDEALGVKYEIR
ncbi:MAG: phosphate/phosphite/phosphonate ABC transporter substrate-binding protein [Planctomycetota bacterium]|nr:MAG: phosphate/phosphite/phosphonate ABC transporter substrate-binding protein [Planctomycetota bacterium]